MRSRLDPVLDQEAKDRIKNSGVLLVGAGALGSHIAENLARYGLELHVVDRDIVEKENLYTSRIYTRNHVKKALPKSKVLENQLSQFSKVDGSMAEFPEGFQARSDYDIVVDATDNLETRLEIEEYAAGRGIPWVYTAVSQSTGYSALLKQSSFSHLLDEGKMKPRSCSQGLHRYVAEMTALTSVEKTLDFLLEGDDEQHLTQVPSMRDFEVETSDRSVKEIEIDHNKCNTEKKRFELSENLSTLAKRIENSSGTIQKRNDKALKAKFRGAELLAFRSGRVVVKTSDKEKAAQIETELGNP